MNKAIKYLLILGIEIIVIWVLFESAGRFLVKPSNRSAGILLQSELPPYQAVSRSCQVDLIALTDQSIINGKKITWGDTSGIFQEHPKIGYVNQRNRSSKNGWRQTNNLGALSRRDASLKKPTDRKRITVFGESLTACVGVPMDTCWAFLVEKKLPEAEVLNFGVPGYSMTQSYLLFQQMVQEGLESDTVLLVFVPSLDLPREVNTLRRLLLWRSYKVYPRFMLDGNGLRLIPSPYPDVEACVADNESLLVGPKLHEHLTAYDTFYFPEMYQDKWYYRSLFLSTVQAWKHQKHILKMQQQQSLPDSEAVQISKRIFQAMQAEVQKTGGKFLLVWMPIVNVDFQPGQSINKHWSGIKKSICSEIECLDLLPAFLTLEESSIDQGYDHSHYGPRVNQFTAEKIAESIKSKN